MCNQLVLSPSQLLPWKVCNRFAHGHLSAAGRWAFGLHFCMVIWPAALQGVQSAGTATLCPGEERSQQAHRPGGAEPHFAAGDPAGAALSGTGSPACRQLPLASEEPVHIRPNKCQPSCAVDSMLTISAAVREHVGLGRPDKQHTPLWLLTAGCAGHLQPQGLCAPAVHCGRNPGQGEHAVHLLRSDQARPERSRRSLRMSNVTCSKARARLKRAVHFDANMHPPEP